MKVTVCSELPAPIESITMNRCFDAGARVKTTFMAEAVGVADKDFFDALFAWAGRRGLVDAAPAPEKVILNGPATIVFFNDGSKVVSKAHGGDTFDPVFGIMACALRKSSNNRERIDTWEPVISFLANFLGDANDCRIIADMLNVTADALELDGVMDAVADCDEREYRDSDCADYSDKPEFGGSEPIVGNDDLGRSVIRNIFGK